MDPKLLLATPFLTSNRGNSITASRLQRFLLSLGLGVELWAYAEKNSDKANPFDDELFDCDVLHVFHAYRFAQSLQFFSSEQRAKILSRPFVVTMTGTDVNHDIYASYRAALMAPILELSSAIVVFNDESKKTMTDAFPNLRTKIQCIPLGVHLPEGLTFKDSTPTDPFARIFLFPAGIRRVKEIAYLFDAFEKLYELWSDLQVWLVGPVLEQDYGSMILQHVQSRPYFRYLGEVPHSEMRQLYDKASLVINSSISEGQPQAILEAMLTGALVAVREIPGNLAIVQDGMNGITFSNPEEFVRKVVIYFSLPEKIKEMKRSAQTSMETKHSPLAEAEAYVRLYQQAWMNKS